MDRCLAKLLDHTAMTGKASPELHEAVWDSSSFLPIHFRGANFRYYINLMMHYSNSYDSSIKLLHRSVASHSRVPTRSLRHNFKKEVPREQT